MQNNINTNNIEKNVLKQNFYHRNFFDSQNISLDLLKNKKKIIFYIIITFFRSINYTQNYYINKYYKINVMWYTWK